MPHLIFSSVSMIYLSSNYQTHDIHYKFERCLADTHLVSLSLILTSWSGAQFVFTLNIFNKVNW